MEFVWIEKKVTMAKKEPFEDQEKTNALARGSRVLDEEF